MSQTITIDRFLTKSEAWVPVAPDGQYKQITARLWGKGLTLRGEVPGAAIAAPRQFCAKAGQFLISRIDARHGAFGIVPAELDGALVSNDFPCFDIDASTVLPHYFEWYSRTPEFVELCRRASEGSTNRVRLKEEKFLKMVVPLPAPDVQRRIVSRLDRVSGLVGSIKKGLDALVRDRRALTVALARRPDLSNEDKLRLGWEQTTLANVLRPAALPIRVLLEDSYPNLGIYSYARGVFSKAPIDGASTSARLLYRVRGGQFIYSRLFAFEGAFAIVPAEFDGVFVSNEFPSFDIVPSYGAAFLRAYFSDPRTWQSLRAGSLGLGSRRQRVNEDHLLRHELWLPPIRERARIAEVFAALDRAENCSVTAEVDSLIPAMLHEIFKRKAAG